jgi:hypothetical protein
VGDVAKAAMLQSLYNCNKRSKKLYHGLFFAMTEMALITAFIFYSELYGKMPLIDLKPKLTGGLPARGRTRA